MDETNDSSSAKKLHNIGDHLSMHSIDSTSSGPLSSVILVKESSLPTDALAALAKHHIYADDVQMSIHDQNERYHLLGVIGAELLLNNSVEISEKSLQLIKRIPLDNPDISYTQLLQLHACYDAIPQSNKVVIFDVNLLVKKAFFGLIYNSTRTALLCDNAANRMVGILSVTDFIYVLLKLRRERLKPGAELKNNCDESNTIDLGDYTIQAWRELIEAEGKLRPFVTIGANESLFHAVELLTKHRIHRLPVIDPETNNPLYILTHKRILKFMWLFGYQLPHSTCLERPPKELGIGCWSDIKYVHQDTPLVQCLEILINQGVSGLPVVERESLVVVDFYARFDAIGIAADGQFDQLDITVEDALAKRTALKGTEKVVSVLETDTFFQTLFVLVERDVHRVCVVDEHNSLKGIISLSDVIKYLVLRPVEMGFQYVTGSSSDDQQQP